MTGSSSLRRLDRWWPPILRLLSTRLIEPLQGTRHVTTAQWLEDFWSWHDQRRSEWRRARLDHVLRHAADHVPFYSGRIGDHAELADLPVVDKATLRRETSAFLSNASGHRVVTKRTGGSTGDPWIYELDRRAFSHMYGAQLFEFGRHGFRYGQRRLYLGAPTSLGLTDVPLSKRLRLVLEQNETGLTGLAIDEPNSIVRAVHASDHGARLWYGYASTTEALARAVIDNDLPVAGPELIVTMAERLEPAWRETIETAFPSSQVIEEYGCNDGGVLAHSCPAGHLHIAENISIVEVLDGDRVCGTGQEGQLTVTNLHALAMPFIRYQVGDRAVVGPDPCPCGRPGMTLAKVTGRTGDRVQTLDGREFGPSAFTQPFKMTPDVRSWQVIQHDPSRVEVRLDVTPTFDAEQRGILEAYLGRLLGDHTTAEIRSDRPLIRTAGGKHRVIVRAPHEPPPPIVAATTNHSNRR